MASASMMVTGETFQISYGKEYSLRDIISECVHACGRKVRVIWRRYRPGQEGMREFFGISKAKKILGYKPKLGLQIGLSKTVAWLKASM